MPTASERDEIKWERAKEIAEASGRKDVYPYIMGIYKKMKPDYFRMKRNGSDICLEAESDAKFAFERYKKTRSSIDLLYLRDRVVIWQTALSILGGDSSLVYKLSSFVARESDRFLV